MEAGFEGGQGPEGAVVPYMEWNGLTLKTFLSVSYNYSIYSHSLTLLAGPSGRTVKGVGLLPATARLLRLWVRIPPGAQSLTLVFVVR